MDLSMRFTISRGLHGTEFRPATFVARARPHPLFEIFLFSVFRFKYLIAFPLFILFELDDEYRFQKYLTLSVQFSTSSLLSLNDSASAPVKLVGTQFTRVVETFALVVSSFKNSDFARYFL